MVKVFNIGQVYLRSLTCLAYVMMTRSPVKPAMCNNLWGLCLSLEYYYTTVGTSATAWSQGSDLGTEELYSPPWIGFSKWLHLMAEH